MSKWSIKVINSINILFVLINIQVFFEFCVVVICFHFTYGQFLPGHILSNVNVFPEETINFTRKKLHCIHVNCLMLATDDI